MRVCALVTDLMDRSRVSNAFPGVIFGVEPDADVVIIDLARAGDRIGEVRAALPDARIVCYGPHVDEEGAEAARAGGADVVLARSRFFRDPVAAVTER